MTTLLHDPFPWTESDRRRLVRLCATVSGDRFAAEDLAQETLLEAYRNAHKLHDPSGADRWLAAIARNVCKRWQRRRVRETELRDDHLVTELELDRAELADLLDRALALLPPDTRDALVHRYVHDLPHAEIGELLGVSEDAVSMRLARGKVVLRRLLREEAESFGWVVPGDDWRETTVWCSACGARKLVALVEPAPGFVRFRCPGCAPSSLSTELRLANPFFAQLAGGLVRPAAILTRVATWSRQYFSTPVRPCTRCGRDVRIERFAVEWGRGLVASCGACGEEVSSTLRGQALASDAARRFRRDHPRTRALPERDDGDRVVVRLEDVASSATLDVVFAPR
jgi:RNA polymerase sigma-70 factor (ECF subfamily)